MVKKLLIVDPESVDSLVGFLFKIVWFLIREALKLANIYQFKVYREL